jgi:hypothetical protein
MALWFNQWLEHLRNSRARFLIFAPVGWANDALQASLPRSEVDFCSLLGDNCVQPRQVARWLQTAPGLPAENIQAADSDGYGRLAEYMVEQAGKMPSGSKGEAADRFHQILDLWYAEACGAGVEGAQESAVPIVEQLKRIWDQLLACHEEEGLPTDVRIDIVRKRPPRPSRGKRPAQPTLTVDWPFKAQKRQKPTEGT